MDNENCAEVRKIVTNIDWPCETKFLFRDKNLGCKAAISSGISWFFDQVEEGIILEDDCLPHDTFFDYCADLLERYRLDLRVTTICSVNMQFGHRRSPYSYYFSRHVHVWGWATWRRAWKNYDLHMQRWPEFLEGGWLKDVWLEQEKVNYWTRMLAGVYQGKINTWDYQWELSCWMQGGLNVIPNVNLVSNIGFSPEATHVMDHPVANMATLPIEFPLQHPPFILQDQISDDRTDRFMYSSRKLPLWKRAVRKGVKILGAFMEKK